MSVQLPQSVQTADDIRKAAQEEFEVTVKRPEPPEPPKLARPAVIQLGSSYPAHAWVETLVTEAHSYGERERTVSARFFLVGKDSSQVLRFEGRLDMEELDALIGQLQQAKADIAAKQAFLDVDARYQDDLQSWKARRAEYARQREATWERDQKKKG